MKKLPLISILFLLIVSCGSKKETFNDYFTNEKSINLTNEIEELIDIIQKPYSICYIDSNFIISNTDCDSLVTIYNMRNQQTKNLFHKGFGPNEILNEPYISNGKNSNELLVLDNLSGKLYNIDLENDYSINQDTTFTTRCEQILYDDTLQFSCLSAKEYQYELTTPNELKYFGDVRKIFNNDSIEVENVLGGFSTISQKNKKICLGWIIGDILEIFDYSNINDIKLSKSLILNFPKMEMEEMIFGNINIGINSITSNDDYIFALYSGNKLSIVEQMVDESEILLCKNILVFDWEGNPIIKFSLDKKVKSIYYSKETNLLYCLGINEQGAYSIFTFDINKNI
ncbi:MAG: TolB-like 6-bladed beta-propeller domain-containing protein [Bacteroidales bacterium]|nr:TolB-like 6-bladed beta-propeller domain-containing protein [Bacteroidales bacterium]